MEYVRDWNFRAMYGAWDALKNVDQVLPNHTLNWSAYILGKRESRRLLGDVVLTLRGSDRATASSPTAACRPAGAIDLHLPDPRYEKGFEGDAFISDADFGQFPAYREHGRSGFPTAASTRATSPTSSWPGATSASRTRRSARCA